VKLHCIYIVITYRSPSRRTCSTGGGGGGRGTAAPEATGEPEPAAPVRAPGEAAAGVSARGGGGAGRRGRGRAASEWSLCKFSVNTPLIQQDLTYVGSPSISSGGSESSLSLLRYVRVNTVEIQWKYSPYYNSIRLLPFFFFARKVSNEFTMQLE
jgi:hypothetical protein